MVKVVETGRIPLSKDWTTRVTCKQHSRSKKEGAGCGAVLEVGASDLMLMFWRGTHFAHYYAAVRCPCCGKYNFVHNAPKPIWEKLNTPENQQKAIPDGHDESILY